MVLRKKPRAILEEWTYSPYKNFYAGKVYNHPRFENGTHIVTSKVIKFDFENNEAETANSFYKLGTKAKEY